MSVRSLLYLSAIAVAINTRFLYADEASSFIIGADVSWVQPQEAEGNRWSDDGVEKDIFAIFEDHGFNWIRLRIFVNPQAKDGYSKEGYCDLRVVPR